MVTIHRLALVFLLLLCAAASASDAVQLRIAEPQVVRRTFERSNPPQDMPKLNHGEEGLTVSDFSIATQARLQILDEAPDGFVIQSRVKVHSITVDTALKITIWLPKKPKADLVAHEEAHRELSEYFYGDARRVAEDLAQPLIGRVFTGRGKTAAEARQAAIQKAVDGLSADFLAAVEGKASRANKRFDEITDHGRRDIAIEKAKRQAIDEVARGRPPR